MSSLYDQHINEHSTSLKRFLNLFLPAILIIGKFFNLNTPCLIILFFPFAILFYLQITTLILIEYEILKTVFKTIFPR